MDAKQKLDNMCEVMTTFNTAMINTESDSVEKMVASYYKHFK